MRDLTPAEEELAQMLGDCFNAHQRLPEVHPHDAEEFMRAIHAAQNIVLARPATAYLRARISGQIYPERPPAS